MKKDLKQRYQDDPNQALLDEVLDVIQETKNPVTKLEAIKIAYSLKDDSVC